MTSFAHIDIAIILGYFALVVGIGFLYAARNRGTLETSLGYFLGNRRLGWVAIGASLFATNISSEHFVGLAGNGARRGLAVGNFEWMAIIFLMMLGWIFAPVLIRSKVFTVPEFFGRRFNPASRLYLAGISIFAYVLTKSAVSLFAGGLLMEQVFGWDIYTSGIVMLMVTGMYTVAGGLGAVVYTSVVQAVFLVVGAVLMTLVGLDAVGGWSGLQAALPEDFFHLFKPATDPEFPWTGILFGAPILGIWYWCTDQYIVQRVLSARSVEAARYGTVLTGFLKILPMFVLVIPGLIAAVLFPDLVGKEAYSMLLSSSLLPAGVKGLVIAGVLAALMSSLAATFNSAATLVTMDVYRHFRPAASERNLVLVGRLSTVVMVLIGIILIPLTRYMSAHIYVNMQSLQAVISPPIAAVFLVGFFWKRINGTGAIWALVLGGLIGLARLTVGVFDIDGAAIGGPLGTLIDLNFLHFAIWHFVASTAILVGVSLASAAPSPAALGGMTHAASSRFSAAGGWHAALADNRQMLVYSALLLIVLAGLMGRFI